MHTIPHYLFLVAIFAGYFVQALHGSSSSLYLVDVSRTGDKVKVSTNNNTSFIIKLLKFIEDHSIFQQFISHYHHTSNIKNSLKKIKYENNLEKLIRSCKTYLEYPTSSYDYLGKDDNDGIIVWKLKNKFIISDDKDADRYPVVKSKVIIKTSIENMLSLLLNSENVKLVNSYSLGRNDIEIIGKNKKIVYNRSKIPIALQSHDYVTLMHWLQDTQNSYMIVSKGITHEKCPINNDYTRSEIILGVNYLKRISEDITEMITINHIKYNR